MRHPSRVQTALWGGVFLALAVLLWLLAPILTPFAVAAVFAYLCIPAVETLVRRRLPRTAAVLLVMGALSLALVALVLILVPMIYREAVLLTQKLPSAIDLLDAHVARLSGRFDMELRLDAAQFREWAEQFFSGTQSVLPALSKHISQGSMAVASLVANLILIPIVTFYLLLEWPRITAGLARVLPRPWLPRAQKTVSAINHVLAQFCRGQGAVMLILAVYYSVGLWLAGLDFALPVGVLTGLLIFIPYVGFGFGLLLALLAALLQQTAGWEPVIGVAIVFGLGQLIESFVLTPYLVGERIGLHPLAVIFALLAFNQLFGFVGILVALPASAALLVGLREIAPAWLASPLYLGRDSTDEPSSNAKNTP
ncbi:MAG: AI-2E family transporter [Azoarcus sp.]|jgi:predicted PurR-regulated permease PerM|nr:AI-2E family transporter [Azoarcus sp.]